VKKNLRSGETLTIAGFASMAKIGKASMSAVAKAVTVYAGKVDHGFDKQSAADLATVSGH
jgi:hypothetical protein